MGPPAARPDRRSGAAAAAALLVPGSSAANPTHADIRTTAGGVYTEAQAREGLEVHQEYCAKCHHNSYYRGSFLLSWQNQPVSALYELIKLRMPEDRPGALQPDEYAALLAYMFELNRMPAGDSELAGDPQDLQNILITRE
jgi:mono/diheme cytochrome c family protein